MPPDRLGRRVAVDALRAGVPGRHRPVKPGGGNRILRRLDDRRHEALRAPRAAVEDREGPEQQQDPGHRSADRFVPRAGGVGSCVVSGVAQSRDNGCERPLCDLPALARARSRLPATDCVPKDAIERREVPLEGCSQSDERLASDPALEHGDPRLDAALASKQHRMRRRRRAPFGSEPGQSLQRFDRVRGLDELDLRVSVLARPHDQTDDSRDHEGGAQRRTPQDDGCLSDHVADPPPPQWFPNTSLCWAFT